MATLDEVVAFVRAEVAGCPDPFIRQSVMRAARDFCERTEAHIEQYSFSTVVGVAEYQLYLTSGFDPCAIHGVVLDENYLVPITARAVPIRAVEGLPAAFSFDGTTLTLIPTPSEVFGVVVSVASKPKLSATRLTDTLLNNWSEALVEAALYYTLRAADTTWGDPQLAAHYWSKYVVRVAEAKGATTFGGYANAVSRVIPFSF